MRLFISLLLLTFCSVILIGQESTPEVGENVRIETTNGTIINGKLISMDDEYLLVETEFGESKILRSEVKQLEYNTQATSPDRKNNTYSGSHYLLSQSAFNLKEGQAYYENLYIFLNSVAYGVTDNFTIIGGAEVISLLFSRFPVMYFTPKFSLPFSGGAASLSTTVITIPQEDFASAGFLQGTLTFGDLASNFSIGAGIGYTFENGFEDAIIPVTLSGMTGISDRLSLLTENWIIRSDGSTEAVISLGLRVHSRNKNNSLSVALWRVTEDTGPLLAWPVVSGTIAID